MKAKETKIALAFVFVKSKHIFVKSKHIFVKSKKKIVVWLFTCNVSRSIGGTVVSVLCYSAFFTDFTRKNKRIILLVTPKNRNFAAAKRKIAE